MTVISTSRGLGQDPAIRAGFGIGQRAASPLMARILPEPVVTAEAFGDGTGIELPSPGDADSEWLAQAAPIRLDEFVTTRRCARKALSAWGLGNAAIARGSRGEPQWPVGFVGSLTHCDGYRAAAVAQDREIASIGIDAELHHPLSSGVEGLITGTAELSELRTRQENDPGIHWSAVLFSAKEAIFKAWYPLTRCELGFRAVTVTVSDDGRFSGTIRHPASKAIPSGDAIDGAWMVDGGFVLTAVVIGKFTPSVSHQDCG